MLTVWHHCQGEEIEGHIPLIFGLGFSLESKFPFVAGTMVSEGFKVDLVLSLQETLLGCSSKMPGNLTIFSMMGG